MNDLLETRIVLSYAWERDKDYEGIDIQEFYRFSSNAPNLPSVTVKKFADKDHYFVDLYCPIADSHIRSGPFSSLEDAVKEAEQQIVSE